MARVGHQRRAFERFGEDTFAKGYRLLLIELVEPMREIRLFRRFDDEGRGVVIEFVDVRLEPAVLGAAESKVKASNSFFVPSQMNRFGLTTRSGLNTSA